MDPRIKTARKWSRPGRAYRRALKEMRYDDVVLDFGCGYGQGAEFMRENAPVELEGVYKLDLNPEWTDEWLPEKAHLVVLSNVLNMQMSMMQIKQLLSSVKSFLEPNATIVASFPREPRKLNLHFNSMKAILHYEFCDMSEVKIIII